MMHIYVSITDQSLTLMNENEVLAQYVISSAANGIGFEEGSYCTPTGRFEISEKIGGSAVSYTHLTLPTILLV